MNNSVKYILSFAAASLLVASCNVSKENATYVPQVGDGNVTFPTTVVTATEIPAADATYSVDLVRSTAEAATMVNLKFTISNKTASLQDDIVCPASASFEAGKYRTTIDLDVSSMEIGVAYNGTLSVVDSSAFNESYDIASVDFTLQKAYQWEDLGEGQYYDSFLIGDILNVKVCKAEGFNLYRIYDPIPKEEVEKAWEGSMVATSSVPSYFEFTIEDDGHVDYGNFIKTGYTYRGADLYYMSPDYFGETGETNNCTLMNGQVVQFYWYQYTTAGIWWGKAYGAYLSFPGGPDLNQLLQ